VSVAAPNRRNQTLLGAGGLVEVDHHVPGPDRPGSFAVVRPDGSRDEIEHTGANASERMVSAFTAEAAGDAEPKWTPTQSIRLARLIDALHRATGIAG
jgi:hypothetical protein